MQARRSNTPHHTRRSNRILRVCGGVVVEMKSIFHEYLSSTMASTPDNNHGGCGCAATHPSTVWCALSVGSGD